MFKTILSAVTAAVVAAAWVFLAGPASADDAKYVKIVQADTGSVLSIAGNSDDNEAKAVVAKDDGSKSQQWQIVKDGEYFKIVNRKSGKVLDVNNQSTDEDAPIIQWDDKADGNDNQRWSWEGEEKDKTDKEKADQPRRLKSRSSNLVLDVNKENEVIQRKADEKAKSQIWKVVEVKE